MWYEPSHSFADGGGLRLTNEHHGIRNVVIPEVNDTRTHPLTEALLTVV